MVMGLFEMRITGKAIAKILDRCCLLLLSDLFVFLLIGSSLEPLPRQATSQEIHEHMA